MRRKGEARDEGGQQQLIVDESRLKVIKLTEDGFLTLQLSANIPGCDLNTQ